MVLFAFRRRNNPGSRRIRASLEILCLENGRSKSVRGSFRAHGPGAPVDTETADVAGSSRAAGRLDSHRCLQAPAASLREPARLKVGVILAST